MIEELRAKANDYCFLCKAKDLSCVGVSFRALSDGSIKCEDCGTQYMFTDIFDGWSRIAERPKKRKRKKSSQKPDDKD